MFAKAASVFQGPQHGKSMENQDEGESLMTILSTAEGRTALTLLVADCTNIMRQGIEDIFDAKQTGTASDMLADIPGEAQSKEEEILEDPMERDRKLVEAERREKELGAPRMQELKSAALSHFDDWHGAVLQRIGEVVNSREGLSNAAETNRQSSNPGDRTSWHLPQASQYELNVQQTIDKLYAPSANSLTNLPKTKRATILHSLLLLLLSLENYQSYSRSLMLRLSTSLDVDVRLLAQDESKVAQGLLSAATHMKADDETKKRAEDNQGSRKWKVGLATVAGAAIIGVTGGLAAPLVAAGVGSVMGGIGLGATAAAGYLGTLAGSTVLVGGLFGAYGGRMTGRMMDQYAREVEDFAFTPIRQPQKNKEDGYELTRLRVCIGISGWLAHEDEIVEPWKVIGSQQETFALQWEVKALKDLGNAITNMVKTAAWGYAKSEIIKRTVFATLAAGLWPLGLLKVSRVIDNPFSVAHHRAIKAGEVLADVLMNKAQGERPVTLVGYSLGAKVIYTCLQRLAERRAFGLIESVVLIGAPAPSTSADWRLIRTVVSGRVVNVYSTNDYILAFLYRSSSIQYGIAGLQAIENVAGVENVDVSDLVTGHTRYRFLTGRILQKIGFEDIDAVEIEREEQQMEDEESKAEAARAKDDGSEDLKQC